MSTPFDDVIEAIKQRGFHNHRLEDHSDLVSTGILRDIGAKCDSFQADLTSGRITSWLNVPTSDERARQIDLLVGEPDSAGNPDFSKLLLCLENKSVITAHRNKSERFRDLNEVLRAVHQAKAEAVLVATVLVGVAERVLNVPDRIKPLYRGRDSTFERRVARRLSSGDQKLWKDFVSAISLNRPNDPLK